MLPVRISREKMKAELEELQLNAVAVPFSFFDKKWDTGNKACTTGIHNRFKIRYHLLEEKARQSY